MTSAVMNFQDDLNEIQRRQYLIGSAADEPVEIIVSGHTYTWPPNSVIEINDRQDYQRDKKGNPIFNRPTKTPDGGDAKTIVLQLFSSSVSFDGGNRGLYPIRNDGRDGERRSAARTRYVAARVERCKETQRRWLRQLDKVKPGDLPPAQPRSVREDIAFLAKYESGSIDRKAFIAFDGGAESDVRAEVESYLSSRYPEAFRLGKRPDGKEGPLVIERDAVVPPAQAVPGIPPVHDTIARTVSEVRADPNPAPAVDMEGVKFLLAEAKKAGVQLTNDEFEAIIGGDQEAMEAVAMRLVETAHKSRG